MTKCHTNFFNNFSGEKMNESANTGLGLIKTTIERVQNQNSVFTSALKKLVNSSEEDLRIFLGKKIDNNIIYTSVTSNGKTGQQWIDYFTAKGIQISDWAKDLLLSDEFVPTNGVTTELAIIKGVMFKDSERTVRNIRAEADKRGFTKPNPEVACLLRDKYSNAELEAMGLWYIVTMHEPIKDSVGDPDLLNVDRDDDSWLDADCGEPDNRFHDESGFAFAISQVSL